jgi:hypothetical protein
MGIILGRNSFIQNEILRSDVTFKYYENLICRIT